MASNILEVPFRRTQPVLVSSAIKSYIESKFEQQSAAFDEDCQAVERLRNEAIHVTEPHVSGIQKLTAYAAQLRYMSSKFPLELGIDFAWWGAIGFHTENPVVHNNLRFELANILFNLAALYSQLAFSNNRTTPEGLKQSAQYGVSAAGVLNFLRTEIIPEMRATPPEDMDDPTLESLEKMCLAQAQECYWGKAVKDNMRDGTIARLAAQVCDYYLAAGDLAIRSDAISTEWIHHFTAKHHHFAAAAQYRQSVDCLEKRKYGEEVARLRDSLLCVNEALKEKKWVNRTVEGDLNGLKSKVTEELRRAERDNDVIYLLPIPPKAELKILDRANMVAPKPPKEVADSISFLGDRGPFGPPLFEKLVPYAVHQAANIYAERRDRIVNGSIIADLEAMTDKLRTLLTSLNLPGSLQALEKPLGVPPSLLTKAEELRQQDAIHRLQRSLDDTTKVKTNDLSIFQEGLSLLESEKAEDNRLRSKYGTDRWARPPSELALAKLYTQATELQGYLNSAGSSDTLIQTKIAENKPILRTLTGTDRDIERYIPSSTTHTLSPALERTSSNLRSTLNDISRFESRRRRKIEALRSKAQSDDINHALLTETARLEREYPMQPISASQFENLFDERLEIYEADRDALHQEQEEQDQLAARVREVNKAFLEARKGQLESGMKEREHALQELEMGYLKYKEIINNIDTGRKFYNDLAGHVSRFRDGVRSAVTQRRQEAGEMEAELGLGGLKLQERRELRSQKRREAEANSKSQDGGIGSRVGGRQSMVNDALPAPVPVQARVNINGGTTPAVVHSVQTPELPDNTVKPGVSAPIAPRNAIWSPEMGIKFGPPAGGR